MRILFIVATIAIIYNFLASKALKAIVTAVLQKLFIRKNVKKVRNNIKYSNINVKKKEKKKRKKNKNNLHKKIKLKNKNNRKG